MIVACPSCGARFNLDSAKLLPAGRNVRCAKCDHRWRQMPEGYEEPGAAPESAPAEAEVAAQPVSESPAPPAPEEPELHPPTPPETPAQMAQSLAAIAEQVAGARGPGNQGGEGYTVSQAAPTTAPNPLARLGRRGPGPITVPPRMRPMRPAKRSSHLGLILLIAGLIIGLLVAGYVFRDVIARTVPGADAIYSALGLSTDNATADLEISNIAGKITRDEKTGHNVIDVSATIFNKSESAVRLPALVVIPLDDVGSQLEPMRFRLQEAVIEPGQNINFRKSFDNWPAGAPGVMIDWVANP